MNLRPILGGQKRAADPTVAREQAREDAKNAGILGSAAPQEGVVGSLAGYGGAGFDDEDVWGGLIGDDGGYGYELTSSLGY